LFISSLGLGLVIAAFFLFLFITIGLTPLEGHLLSSIVKLNIFTKLILLRNVIISRIVDGW
jgi:hypothetical protein